MYSNIWWFSWVVMCTTVNKMEIPSSNSATRGSERKMGSKFKLSLFSQVIFLVEFSHIPFKLMWTGRSSCKSLLFCLSNTQNALHTVDSSKTWYSWAGRFKLDPSVPLAKTTVYSSKIWSPGFAMLSHSSGMKTSSVVKCLLPSELTKTIHKNSETNNKDIENCKLETVYINFLIFSFHAPRHGPIRKEAKKQWNCAKRSVVCKNSNK